jgi:hypothetical protein
MGGDFDNVLGILKARHVDFDADEARVRGRLVVDALRGKPGALNRIRAFGQTKQSGGAAAIPIAVPKAPGDFIGEQGRWFIKAAGSPYLQALVRMSFTVIFFLSYIESIPIAGSLVSATLDIALSGGRILIKQLQTIVPTLVGLIPLPFMNLVGIGMVSIVGMILWPLLAIISFSRQDFASAIESFIRVIPPPIGTGLADAFLDANRTVSKLDNNRQKVLADLVAGLGALQQYGPVAADQTKKGAQKLLAAVREVQQEIPTATAVPEPTPVNAPMAEPVPTAEPVTEAPPPSAPPMEPTSVTAPKQLRGGRKTLSNKPTKSRKWKTRRHRKSVKSSEPGSR